MGAQCCKTMISGRASDSTVYSRRKPLKVTVEKRQRWREDTHRDPNATDDWFSASEDDRVLNMLSSRSASKHSSSKRSSSSSASSNSTPSTGVGVESSHAIVKSSADSPNTTTEYQCVVVPEQGHHRRGSLPSLPPSIPRRPSSGNIPPVSSDNLKAKRGSDSSCSLSSFSSDGKPAASVPCSSSQHFSSPAASVNNDPSFFPLGRVASTHSTYTSTDSDRVGPPPHSLTKLTPSPSNDHAHRQDPLCIALPPQPARPPIDYISITQMIGNIVPPKPENVHLHSTDISPSQVGEGRTERETGTVIPDFFIRGPKIDDSAKETNEVRRKSTRVRRNTTPTSSTPVSLTMTPRQSQSVTLPSLSRNHIVSKRSKSVPLVMPSPLPAKGILKHRIVSTDKVEVLEAKSVADEMNGVSGTGPVSDNAGIGRIRMRRKRRSTKPLQSLVSSTVLKQQPPDHHHHLFRSKSTSRVSFLLSHTFSSAEANSCDASLHKGHCSDDDIDWEFVHAPSPMPSSSGASSASSCVVCPPNSIPSSTDTPSRLPLSTKMNGNRGSGDVGNTGDLGGIWNVQTPQRGSNNLSAVSLGGVSHAGTVLTLNPVVASSPTPFSGTFPSRGRRVSAAGLGETPQSTAPSTTQSPTIPKRIVLPNPPPKINRSQSAIQPPQSTVHFESLIYPQKTGLPNPHSFNRSQSAIQPVAHATSTQAMLQSICQSIPQSTTQSSIQSPTIPQRIVLPNPPPNMNRSQSAIQSTLSTVQSPSQSTIQLPTFASPNFPSFNRSQSANLSGRMQSSTAPQGIVCSQSSASQWPLRTPQRSLQSDATTDPSDIHHRITSKRLLSRQKISPSSSTSPIGIRISTDKSSSPNPANEFFMISPLTPGVMLCPESESEVGASLPLYPQTANQMDIRSLLTSSMNSNQNKTMCHTNSDMNTIADTKSISNSGSISNSSPTVNSSYSDSKSTTAAVNSHRSLPPPSTLSPARSDVQGASEAVTTDAPNVVLLPKMNMSLPMASGLLKNSRNLAPRINLDTALILRASRGCKTLSSVSSPAVSDSMLTTSCSEGSVDSVTTQGTMSPLVLNGGMSTWLPT